MRTPPRHQGRPKPRTLPLIMNPKPKTSKPSSTTREGPRPDNPPRRPQIAMLSDEVARAAADRAAAGAAMDRMARQVRARMWVGYV
eukprot:359935-Chlamydomonas_euryale.AAC.5